MLKIIDDDHLVMMIDGDQQYSFNILLELMMLIIINITLFIQYFVRMSDDDH